jgi:hypothetical protein
MFYWISNPHNYRLLHRFIHPRNVAWILVCFTSYACNNVETTRTTAYYPVDSLITAQIQYLNHAGATLSKVALLGDQESRSSLNPDDSSVWVKELDIFRELNVINKPINRGAYTVEDGLRDSRSNLKIKVFTAKEPLPVEYLRVYYQGTIDQLRKIESKYHEENVMYQGTRYLILEFEQIKDKSVLTYYSMYGGQKMFLGDSVQYKVNASVILPNE